MDGKLLTKIDFSRWGTMTNNSATQTGEGLPYLDIMGEDKPVPYLFTLNASHGLCVEGTLLGIQGKEKTGKSAFGVALIVSAFCPEGFLSITPNTDNITVLWVDTEQDTNTLRLRVRSALRQANAPLDTPRLRVLTLLGIEKRHRLRMVEEAQRETGANLILLDGLIDLCDDFNEAKDSEKVYQALLALAQETQCCICCVVHENPHEEKARGHLGTMLGQRATQLFRVEKSDDVATVKYLRGRFQSAQGFPEMGFEFGEGFEIHETDISRAKRIETKKGKLWDIFEPVFRGNDFSRMSATTLKQTVAFARNIQEKQARNTIKEACATGVLFREEEGKNVFYSLMGCTFSGDDSDL